MFEILVRMKPDRVCTIVMACAVLHNIAQDRHEPMPQEDEFGLVELEDVQVERDGVTARDYNYCTNIFCITFYTST